MSNSASDAANTQRKLARFQRWVAVIAMQTLFGASVFILTKAHYSRLAASPPDTAAAAAVGATARPTAPAIPAASFVSNDPALLRNQAAQQFQNQDYAGAVASYERLIALEPDDADLLNNLGLVLHYVNRSEDAIDRLQQALALNDRHQRSWLTLGFVRKDLGQTKTARAAFERVLQIDNQSTMATEARRMLDSLDTSEG
jgi:tetratricopeptide (TPR) repeat protein